jgi:inosine-uridine nucleoside N-ribohydrolase
LADLLARRRLHIAAIGPLTNMALLTITSPNASRTSTPWSLSPGAVGTAFFYRRCRAVQDFNFENDVRAMQILLDSQIPMVFSSS